MTRETAIKLLREELNKHGLQDWHVRLTNDLSRPYLGICLHKDSCIVLNAHHIDIHPDEDIVDTIKHEVAHALTPSHGHDEIWAAKATELGCTSTQPCSHLSFSPDIIDAIRSGANVKITFEEEIIRRPKYEITRLQDKCEFCNKVAIEKSSILIENDDPYKPNKRFIALECGHSIIKNIKKGTPFHLFISNRDVDSIKNCKHEWGAPAPKKNQCWKCGEFMPLQFQLEGMRFGEAAIAVKKGACIFDDMGLGKTITALGIIYFNPDLWPTLYAVKSKSKFQWLKQILRWMGPEFVPQIIQTSSDLLIPNLRSYIIGYDMMVTKVRQLKGKTITQGFDIKKFETRGIKSLVLDECQQIKNPDSSRTQQVRRIAKYTKVIPLSGTPWKNRGSEFFSVLNMVDPIKFSTFEGYKRTWVQVHYDGKYVREGGINSPEKFKEYISDIAIRRERKDVMPELPQVNRTKLYVKMGEDELDIYGEAEDDFTKWYNEMVIGGREDQLSGMNILAKMSKMRHLTGLAKIPATLEYAEEFIDDTEGNLVIFVHHQDVAHQLLSELKEVLPKINVCALAASTADNQIQEVIRKFNSNRSICIASTLSAGEGTDGLQDSAYTLVMHERQWNPMNEEQAEGRLDRYGQKSGSVDAIYVEAEDSIDEHFDKIVERKRLDFHAAMNKGTAPVWNTNDIAKELAESIAARNRKRNLNKKNQLVGK